MANTARGLRVPNQLEQAIREEAESRGKSWSAMAKELLAEALKMRRAPGVAFADGPTGRRAVVAGSGLDVREIVATYQAEGDSYAKLRASYPWLTEPQLRAALAYYELYPGEVEARLEP